MLRRSFGFCSGTCKDFLVSSGKPYCRLSVVNDNQSAILFLSFLDVLCNRIGTVLRRSDITHILPLTNVLRVYKIICKHRSPKLWISLLIRNTIISDKTNIREFVWEIIVGTICHWNKEISNVFVALTCLVYVYLSPCGIWGHSVRYSPRYQ